MLVVSKLAIRAQTEAELYRGRLRGGLVHFRVKAHCWDFPTHPHSQCFSWLSILCIKRGRGWQECFVLGSRGSCSYLAGQKKTAVYPWCGLWWLQLLSAASAASALPFHSHLQPGKDSFESLLEPVAVMLVPFLVLAVCLLHWIIQRS